MTIDYTRGDSPAYDGYRENWVSQREEELQIRIDELETDLRLYKQAEEKGRLIIFDEPRLPLIWGDEDREILLCPACKNDLMGGFPEEGSEHVRMYQCIYCGQYIDDYRAVWPEEADAALQEVKG